MRTFLDSISPLLITGATDIGIEATNLPVDVYLKDIAYILSIVYAIVKLYKHYKPTDHEL